MLCWVIRRLVDAFSRRECTMTGEPPDASWSTAAGSLATRLGIFPERFGGADSGVGVDDIGSVGFVASPWEEAVKQATTVCNQSSVIVGERTQSATSRRAGGGWVHITQRGIPKDPEKSPPREINHEKGVRGR